ncbi:MAG: hypothetical protein ABIK36_17820 [Pseudomonadota bacterium]
MIPDDLIVQGSLCTGFDCVNNESFGFSTIRLKENNLRIEFDDTSVGTFPANDWQIIANDSASGGASFLGIFDQTASRQIATFRAGAPANSLFMDSTGRIGLRTATPVLDLHINTSNTPAIRLEQNNSGGFTAQTWDVAGNEANFFVRDVTGGSRLSFRIRPGAPTSSIDIASNGNVGIGTGSPTTKLHMQGTGSVVAMFQNADRRWSVGVNPSNNFRISDNTAVVDRFVITTAGAVQLPSLPSCAAGIVTNASGVLSCAVSSGRFKTISGALDPQKALANVMAFEPRVGVYNDEPSVPEHWLIAEDVAEIDPALAGFKDGVPYTVKTSGVVTNLVAVIQMQQQRIEALERAVDTNSKVE